MPEPLVHVISHYGYTILFAAVLLMNAGIPIPGHQTYLAAAVLSGRGVLELPWVIAISVVAAFLGAVAGYLIGARGGRTLIESYGPRIGLNAIRLAKMDELFARHGAKAVFLARFFIVVRTFGHVLAGVNRFPARAFTIVTAVGAIAWGLVYGLAGYFLGERFNAVEAWIGRAGLVVIGVLLLGGVVLLLLRWRRSARRS